MTDPTQNDPTTPPPDPNLAALGGDPGAVDLRGGGKSKLPMLLAGVAIAGGIGFAVFKMMHTRKQKELHAAVMGRFKDVESDKVAPFWVCLLGPNVDPGLFPDNLALGQRVEAAFAGDPLHYPEKVMDECVPKLKGVGDEAAALDAPADYHDALRDYGKAVDGLAVIGEWAQHAKTRGVEREATNKINAAGTAFHAVDGKPSPEAISYDRFLRCVFPDLDKMADEQPMLEKLFEECKKPEFVSHLRDDCGKAMAASDGKEDKNFKDSLKKFGADDRDLSALADCFKKGRKGEKRDEMAPFGKAWADYMKAGGAVRKIGKDALKED